MNWLDQDTLVDLARVGRRKYKGLPLKCFAFTIRLERHSVRLMSVSSHDLIGATARVLRHWLARKTQSNERRHGTSTREKHQEQEHEMLLDELKKRMMAAMKAGNVTEKEILRTALGEITGSFKSTDEEVTAVLKKLVKSNRETLALSTDEANKTTLREEIAILQSFLPKTLDVDAIVGALEPVKAAVKDAKSDGQAMGVASKHLKSIGAAVESEDVKAAIAKLRA